MDLAYVVLLIGYILVTLWIMRDKGVRAELRELCAAFVKVVRALPQFYMDKFDQAVEYMHELGEEPAEKVKRDVFVGGRFVSYVEGSEWQVLMRDTPPDFHDWNDLTIERCIPTPLYIMCDDVEIDSYGLSEMDMKRAVKLLSTPWEEQDMLAQHLNILKDEADES